MIEALMDTLSTVPVWKQRRRVGNQLCEGRIDFIKNFVDFATTLSMYKPGLLKITKK